MLEMFTKRRRALALRGPDQGNEGVRTHPQQMRIFVLLPTLDHLALQKRLDDIGAEQANWALAD